MLTRRRLLQGAPWLVAAALPARAADGGVLRFVRARHRTLLLDLDGRSVLVDPSFEHALGVPGLVEAPPPAIDAGAVGALDLLLVTGSEPGAFSPASTRRLRDRTVRCLVPDERIAKTLRHQGFRRVRVVVAGDRFTIAGIEVLVSPSATLGSLPGVGYHLTRAGRSVWCAGAPPPVDVDGRAPAFARAHPAELVAVCALGLSVGGMALTLDADDALLLAGLARARHLVPLHLDAAPTGLGALLLARARSVKAPGPGGPRLVVVPPGTWCRVGTFG